jgi:bacterioferritin
MWEKNKYTSNIAYPEIKVSCPNKGYALLLRDDYAGLVSEMTAINQYLYHYFDNKFCNKEMAETLEKIAIVEMQHLEILAELIVLLGEKPVYFSQNTFWNGSFVDYGNNLLDQLRSDLAAEMRAIEKYNMHIRMINDPCIQKVLERIVLDEQVHVRIFTDMINALTCA